LVFIGNSMRQVHTVARGCNHDSVLRHELHAAARNPSGEAIGPANDHVSPAIAANPD
jgi:hypothetical protein